MDPRLKAFLDTIAYGEGTSTEDISVNDGYDVIVTGEVPGSNGTMMRHEEVFTDYSDHPFANGRAPILVRPGLYSTASGRYQLMLHWWLAYKVELKLTDFSPASQDAVAVQQITERHAIPMIEAGNIVGAIAACSNLWASLPGNSYDQGGKTMAVLETQYNSLLNS